MSNPAVPPWYVLYGDDLQALAWLLLALSLASSPLLRKALAQRKVGNQNRLFLEFLFLFFWSFSNAFVACIQWSFWDVLAKRCGPRRGLLLIVGMLVLLPFVGGLLNRVRGGWKPFG